MKLRRSLFILAAAGLAASAAPAGASANPAYDLSAIFSGNWQGVTPGNELRLQIRSVPTDPSHLFDLFVQVSGKYQRANVRLQGVMRLESQARDVSLTYVPHFDPTVSAVSPDATRFTEQEANAACSLNMKARGDGFAGETLGSSCAVALRGAFSKWTIEVEPGTIRLRDAKTGETLRFRRVSKQ